MIKLTTNTINKQQQSSLIWYISLYWSKISAAASSTSSHDLREVLFQCKDAVHLVHDQDPSSL